MAIVITDSQHYTNIAAAIRAKNGLTTTYKPSEMPAAILGLASRINGVSISEDSDTYTVTFVGGMSVSGSASFDDSGMPVSLTDDAGNSVEFLDGHPSSATDSDGHTVSIQWG